MKEQNRFWRVISPLIVQMGISFLVSLGITVVLLWRSGAGTIRQMNEELYRYGALIQGITALGTIPFLSVMFHRDRILEKQRENETNQKAAIWKYAAIVVLSAALCIGVNNLMIMGKISTVGKEYVEMLEGLYSAPLMVQMVCLVLLTPLCEELVYRGLIFKRVRESTSFVRASFFSALIFGLMHMNLVQMLYGFFLGLVFAYLYEKYGSFKAPVLAHMTANFVSVAGTHYQWFDWMMETPVRIGTGTVLCAAAAATVYVWMERYTG